MRGEGRAEVVPDEAGGAGPAGCEGQAGPGHEAEAVNVAAMRQEPGADSEAQSKAEVVGAVKGVSEGVKQGPVGCASEVVVVGGAGWEAETLMEKPVGALSGCWRLLVTELVTVLIWAG